MARVGWLPICCLLSWALCAWPASALARPLRRVFEPTDLEFQEPGVFEQDYEFGIVRGEDAYRLSVPDFELALGLSKSVELDIDGDSAVAGPNQNTLKLNRFSPDNLWTSLKVGLIDYADDDDDSAWALGLQAGPKIPIARNAQGVGVEGLLLLGFRFRHNHVVLNAGGLRDPRGSAGAPQPSAAELGVNLDLPLDATEHWSVGGGIGAVLYTSPDPNQATALASISWAATDTLSLSVNGLYGLLRGGDQFGGLFGIVQQIKLW